MTTVVSPSPFSAARHQHASEHQGSHRGQGRLIGPHPIPDKGGGTGRGPVCDPGPVFEAVRQAGSSDGDCSSGANV